MIGTLLLSMGGFYAASHGLRLALAWQPPTVTTGPAASVTVLQPILSGDPALAATLAHGPDQAKAARFVWLVDEDDAEGSGLRGRWKRTGMSPLSWALRRRMARTPRR